MVFSTSVALCASLLASPALAPFDGPHYQTARAPIGDWETVESTLSLEAEGAGILRKLWVFASISHSYRGDLRVELAGPSAQRYVLHDRQGAALDDLVIDLELEVHTSSDAAGDWTLVVEDHATFDTGTLVVWGLAFAYEQGCDTAGRFPKCPAGDFCDFPLFAGCGWSDMPGICTPIPTHCPSNLDPVCGCDLLTHRNACDANAAGTSVYKEGACKQRLEISDEAAY